VSRLSFCPRDGHILLELARYPQVFDNFIINLMSNGALPHLEHDVSNAHKDDIDRQGHDWEGDIDHVKLVHLDKREQEHAQHVLKVET